LNPRAPHGASAYPTLTSVFDLEADPLPG